VTAPVVDACFWFEREGVDRVVEALGHDRLLFETDFPHPTCLYPNGVDLARRALAALDTDIATALMGGNAARLYRVS
jgi:predicted TIM-barrel fold metal-dependent hydrolase